MFVNDATAKFARLILQPNGGSILYSNYHRQFTPITSNGKQRPRILSG
jgi:hypothetical protein